MASRVLLIESEEALRSAIVRAMRARGVGVDALDPMEAIDAVENGAFYERALIDLELHGTNGVAVAEALLEVIPGMEITFAAGGADAQLLCKAHALGVVIWKPLGLGPLCDRFGMPQRRSSTVLKKISADDIARAKASGES